ncbi:HNH endonuclease family protein [Streptomyces sp. NPDC003077]|uniref:HNH endonuclease family protein n=1 Tax=Streptomyces sp. NPDC003077 TaxID=3154443 RepID=UPI0033BD44D0
MIRTTSAPTTTSSSTPVAGGGDGRRGRAQGEGRHPSRGRLRSHRAARGVLAGALAAAVLAGCGAKAEAKAPHATGKAPTGKATTKPGRTSGDRTAVSPLDNPDGTRPGLAALTSQAERARGAQYINGVRTAAAGRQTGYDRKKFGYAWMDTADGVPMARNHCDTRNDLLRRDGKNLRFRSGSRCVVVSMNLHDPYTGKDIAWKKQKAAAVQIDHVVPLSYSWRMGSARWNQAKRQQLANDPLNLLPVDGPANNGKGDSGPSEWLPPNKDIRCAYAVRFAQVAVKYGLPVTRSDKKVMLAQCGK